MAGGLRAGGNNKDVIKGGEDSWPKEKSSSERHLSAGTARKKDVRRVAPWLEYRSVQKKGQRKRCPRSQEGRTGQFDAHHGAACRHAGKPEE